MLSPKSTLPMVRWCFFAPGLPEAQRASWPCEPCPTAGGGFGAWPCEPMALGALLD